MLQSLDDMLRSRGDLAPGVRGGDLAGVAAASVLGGMVYGAVMGSYGLRPLQMLYSALKVPLLVGVSALVCLPNLLALNTVLGLRRDLAAVLRGAVLAQGTVSVTLSALAPINAVAYLSLDEYGEAVLVNGLFFMLAAAAGQATLIRHYRPLIASDPRHRVARNAWLGLYSFTAIQMGWVLRPFIGDPNQPTRFFRQGAWSNAYVEVAELIWGVLTR